MKKCQPLVNVSIRRQGRVLFWLKLLLLSCERLCKASHSEHCSANTFFIASFPQPDKQLFCAQSLDCSTLQQQLASPSQETALAALLPARCSEPSGARNPGVLSTRSCSHHRHRGGPRLQPGAVPVCSEKVSLHSISFVNRARSSCTKYCNDSD